MTGIKYQKKDKKIKIFYEFIYNDTSTKRVICVIASPSG